MPTTAPVEAKEKQYVTDLLEKDYEAEVIKSALPGVVEFFTNDSVACMAFAPRYGAVAEKFDGKLRFFRILRQSSASLAEKLNVTASPTVVFFKGGAESGTRLTGTDIKRTDLKAQVEALLK